jgi:hypothetical protein
MVVVLDNLSLSAGELEEIDGLVAADGGVDLWRKAREGALQRPSVAAAQGI